jgi:subtilisin-like proprotein convertase family protein
MKKITLLMLFIIGIGYSQTSNLVATGAHPDVHLNGNGALQNFMLAPCSFSQPMVGAPNGYSITSTDPGRSVADDFVVSAGEIFEPESFSFIVALFDPNVINSTTIVFYSDNGGLPGTVIATLPSQVPVSQAIVGTAFSRNLREVIFDLSSSGVSLDGGAAGTKYWVALENAIPNVTDNPFWLAKDLVTGSEAAYKASTNGYVWQPGALTFGVPRDMVFLLSGDCSPASGGPVAECGTGNPQPIPASGSGGAGCASPTLSLATVAATGTIGTGSGDYILDSIEIDLQHTWASDLDIYLVSPGGAVTVELSTDNGGSTGLDTRSILVFDDGSANAITGWTGGTPAGDYLAEGGLLNTLLAGQSINGDWTLRICDDSGGDTGTLYNYCINFSEITVVGNPPTIVCPADIVINNTASTCGGVANFAGVAFDVEDGNISGDIIATPASGSTFPVGDTVVELSVTDSDGNTVTCNFMVTVVDNEAPVAVCQDITVDLDPVTGMATITAADVDNGSTDNCGIASMTLDISSFDCSMTGANTVTLTVTDNAGNSSTCTSTVTVQDVTAPVITCIGAPGTVTDTASDSPALAIPDSNPAGVSTTITVADDFDITDLNVNLDITHTWVGDLIVTLESPAGTTAVLIDRMGTTSGGVGCSSNDLMITLDDEAATPIEDECQPGPPAASGSFTPNNPLSAFDGESSMGDWTLTVSDNAGGDTGTLNTWGLEYSYDVSATPLDVFLDANGMVSVDPNDLIQSVDEACGYTISAGGVGGGSSETLPTTFAGGNGNFGNMFDVNAVTDVTIDSFDINADTGATFDVEVYAKTGTWVGFEADPSAWTLIGTAVAVVSNGDGVATPLNLTLNYVMAAGETHAFYVTPTDFSTGGLNYTNGTGTGNVWASDANIEFLEGGARGYPFSGSTFQPRVFNGNIHYTTGGGSGLDFTCADLGENQIEVTVTDDSGNVSTCIATINVIDLIAPVITCGPEPTVTETVSDSPNLAIPDNDPTGVTSILTVTDDVSIDDLNVNLDITHTWVGDINVTITSPAGTSVMIVDRIGGTGGGVGCSGDDILATLDDAAALPIESQCGSGVPSIDGTFSPNNPLAAFNGESTLGDWIITISDNAGGDTGTLNSWGITYSYANTNTDIVIELGQDGTATIDPYDIISGVIEACGIATAAVDITEVSCADIGTVLVVTAFVSDTSGNIASCSANVIVVDLLGPELTCPADQTVDPGAGNLFYILPDYFATGEAIADDNCTDPVTILSQDPAPGTPLPDGTYTITMTATDEYGNVSTCSFELTVETTLGVDSNNLDKGLALYPNPADNVVNLVNKTNISLEKMMIYDINGKLVSQTDLRTMQGVKAVDVSSLASGVYMVQIIGDSASTVKRLIKE